MSIFGRKKFKPAAFTGDKGYTYRNIRRGWYRPYPFELSRDIDTGYMDSVISREENICLVELLIEKSRDEAMAQSRADIMRRRTREILEYFIERGKYIIVRPTYDLEGRAIEKEPDFIEDIYADMDILLPVELEYADYIMCHQGLFVGNWGEMHGSRFLGEKSIEGLYYRYDRHAGDKLLLAVRTPVYLQQVAMLSGRDIALFDDALASSDTDMGTFNCDIREHELDYVQDQTAGLPNGGEAVYSESHLGVADTIKLFEKLNLTYLGSQYDRRMLDYWKSQNYQGMSAYEYISRHLGYYYEITSAELDSKSGLIKIVVENHGFGQWTGDCGKMCCEMRMDRSEDIICAHNDIAADTGNRSSLPSGHKSCDAVFTFDVSCVDRGEHRVDIRVHMDEDTILFLDSSGEDGWLSLGTLNV